MNSSLFSISAVAWWLLVPGSVSDTNAQESAQTAAKFRATVTQELALDYLLHLPEGYAAPENAGKQWPLLIFLHGAGERGADLERLKVHGPPKAIEAGRKFPAIVISPQCPTDSWWSEEPVPELIDHAEKTYRVDADRIYLTGLSMGGYGTWAFASRAPDRFAAIVPICGGGVPYQMRKLTGLPIWAFHGRKDTAVPFEETERLVKALERAGSTSVTFTAYPEAGHDSWTAAYETPALWEWLFAQKRGQATAPAPEPQR